MRPLEVWGGVECTVNRVGDGWFDQLERGGHAARLDDLDRIAALNIRTVRFPILWERHAPSSLDAADWSWADARLERLRALGIRPIAGLLHHGSGPRYTSLLDERFPEQLAAFAGMVAARYPWVTDFTPVNEPLTTARFSALYGHWYPHHRDDRSFVRALLHQLRGVVLAMRAIRSVTPGARLIQTEDCGCTFGTPATDAQARYETQRRWLTFDLLTGRVDAAHPLRRWLMDVGATAADLDFFCEHACPPDVLGLNYYVTSDRWLDDRLERYPPAVHGGNGELRYADVEAVRARVEGIAGHCRQLLSAWRRYGIPLAVTEVHLACTREEQMRWLAECWRGAQEARALGAHVVAIAPWALFGSHDWSSLVTRDNGDYEPGAFDVRGPEPRPTAVATLIRTLASGGEPAHPVLATPGWWRRPERLLYRPALRRVTQPSGAPLLIVGASGTLGRAFARMAVERGLPARLLGRPDIDATDPTSVDAAIRRVRPWAVINTAGYVRVDAAETDAEACARTNVAGALNLAAACRRHGLPFVTFSSDLVFGGAERRPYVETDVPSPLNVYGASKAEAERRVLDLLPDALVIRTSAFFGPWDEANFVAAVLRAIAADEPFHAADDAVVSPTYVPDLVGAALDLLIDGEGGIWHLANAGAVTWHDFAILAARSCGRATAAIRPAPTAACAGPAPRPAYSALGSTRGTIMRPLEHALAAFAAATADGHAITRRAHDAPSGHSPR